MVFCHGSPRGLIQKAGLIQKVLEHVLPFAEVPVKTWAFLIAQLVKNLLANAGDVRDVGSISGFGRSPGVGNGNRTDKPGRLQSTVQQRIRRD